MYLKDNVYFVKGIKGATIYDLNTCILYHLNENARILLEKTLNCNKCALTAEETHFISSLRDKDLITNEYNQPQKITELKSNQRIDFVWIEITTGCNLRCIHCYEEASISKVRIMNYLDFCHIVDELVENKISKLQIIGGEPFILGEDLKNYLDYCVGKFDYLEIFTNGTLLNTDWILYLKENNIHISLSVYSYIESEHNRITRDQTSFRKTNDTIQKLHELGVKYRVKNVLMANLDQGERNTDLYRLSYKHDVVRMAGRADFSLLDKDLIKKKLITFETFTRKLDTNLLKRSINGHNCFSRRLYFSVDSEVFPCVMERRISHGNLKNASLKDIIKPDIIHFGKDHIKECSDCEFRFSCFDCRPDAIEEDIAAKPWYCTYDPYETVWQDPDEFISQLFNKTD